MASSGQLSPVKEGDFAPDFTANDQHKTPITLSALRPKNVVLYFYPADNTAGCMRQTKRFQQKLEDFDNTVILGISAGDEEGKAAMSAACGNVSFSLLADKGREIRKLYGVKKDFLGLADGRTTYMIDGTGRVVKVFRSSTNMEAHVDEALKTFGKDAAKEDL
jgi:peroxiredoxin Q/BCP